MLDLGGVFRQDAEIEQLAIDRLTVVVAALLDELSPSRTTELLGAWERVYGIVPSVGATQAERRSVLLAHVRATGGVHRGYYESIATGMGYTIGVPGDTDPHLRFVEGAYAPFRADYGRAGVDAVYDQDSGASMYTIQVRGTNVAADALLRELLDDQKPVGAELEFIDE